MCGLCGVLGAGEHWAESADGRAPASGDSRRTRRAERLRRVEQVNAVLRHYALRLDDWQGMSYLLSNRTGRTELVDNITHVWQAAERMLGRRCDPLDPDLIDRLEGRA